MATGETREIDDVDLFSQSCPVRFIITVAALKEGWTASLNYLRKAIAAKACQTVNAPVRLAPTECWFSTTRRNKATFFSSGGTRPDGDV